MQNDHKCAPKTSRPQPSNRHIITPRLPPGAKNPKRVAALLAGGARKGGGEGGYLVGGLGGMGQLKFGNN